MLSVLVLTGSALISRLLLTRARKTGPRMVRVSPQLTCPRFLYHLEVEDRASGARLRSQPLG